MKKKNSGSRNWNFSRDGPSSDIKLEKQDADQIAIYKKRGNFL